MRHRAALVGPWPADLVDGVTEAVASDLPGGPASPAVQPAERHALRRLREGTALRDVVLDVAGLREAILDLWDGERGAGPAEPALRLLNQVVDSVIGASSERYLSARDRTLQALDRISSVALETRRLDDLLQRLLQVIVESAAAVDTGSILLRDGDDLMVRGAVGLEEELRGEPLRLRIGDGFAGRIASERRPRFLAGDEIEAEVVSPFLKARRLSALYGVPLQSEGQLVGVAHIGSATAGGFSDQDRWLFEAMCARATASISQHLLQEASVARARDLETVLQSIPDMTQRKRDDAERERLYGEAKQAVADRQHVLSVVSHDLRNPLNTILLAAETLKDDGIPAEMRGKGVSAISRAGARMNRMISDLLDINSIEAGRLAINPMPIDPSAVMAEVLDLFGAQAASRNVTLFQDVPNDLPLIRGDRHRLVQVLANLVSNALKVSAEGSITTRLRQADREVVFAVIDSGPGIPEETRGRIFDPYWRADNATYKGTGLGLAIVRGIVEGHGGRVWIDSEPGHGAAFLFGIPTA